jgi:hypothetical protein
MRIKFTLVVLSMFLLAGPAHAQGPWRASETNARGWQFMTPEERIEHQAKVRGFRTYEECRTYQTVYTRTNGISASVASCGDREI